ncbi:hypothetical protein ID866_8717 [Astraeus odoratus]|nr:hypothetical protein ID866_8717 [Astraeus odoratus]
MANRTSQSLSIFLLLLS